MSPRLHCRSAGFVGRCIEWRVVCRRCGRVDTKNLHFRVFESAAKDFGGSRRLLGMRGDPVPATALPFGVPDIEGTVAALVRARTCVVAAADAVSMPSAPCSTNPEAGGLT
jgi:hypothetical protein